MSWPLLALALTACASSASHALPSLRLPAAPTVALTPPELTIPYPLFCGATSCTISVILSNPSDVTIPIGSAWLRIRAAGGGVVPTTISPSSVTDLKPGATTNLSLLTSSLVTAGSMVYTGPTGQVILPIPAEANSTAPSQVVTPSLRPAPAIPVRPPVPVRQTPVPVPGRTENPGAGSGSIG